MTQSLRRRRLRLFSIIRSPQWAQCTGRRRSSTIQNAASGIVLLDVLIGRQRLGLGP